MIIERQLDTPLKRHFHVVEMIRILRLMLQEPDVDPNTQHDFACQIQTLAAGGEQK